MLKKHNGPEGPVSGQGLFNQSSIDVNDDGSFDEYREDCGDLPSLSHTKTLFSIDEIGLNTYKVQYSIVVVNSGGVDANYSLQDMPQFDDDIQIFL